MDLFSLAKLTSFSEEISRRLIAFSAKIDEAPSSIKSIGYEIRSTADVINELHTVLAQQQNERMSSFSESAIEGIEEAVEKCDEVIYEVARAVLVAHERMKKLPMIDGKITLGIHERAQWPLFQLRLYSLIRELTSAKMDIVMYLLVLQIRSERDYGKRIQSVLFASLSREQCEEIIAHLWQGKSLQEPEQNMRRTEAMPVASLVRESGLRNMRISTADTDSSDEDSPEIESRKRGRRFLRRLAEKFSRSNSKFSSKSPHGSHMRYDGVRSHRGPPSRANSHARTLDSTSSRLSARSVSDLSSVAWSARPGSSLASKQSSASSLDLPSLQQRRMSIFSLAGVMPVTPPDAVPKMPKRSMLQHGPTMAAKRGIEQEWEAFRTLSDWEQGSGAEEQRLGHQLLLSQLLSKIRSHDQDMVAPSTTIDMLVTRWTTVDTLVMRWTTVPRRDTIAGSQVDSVPRLPTSAEFIPQIPLTPANPDLRFRNYESVEPIGLSVQMQRREASESGMRCVTNFHRHRPLTL